jgi:hypothetical protein
VGSSYSYPFFGADFGVCGDKAALRGILYIAVLPCRIAV